MRYKMQIVLFLVAIVCATILFALINSNTPSKEELSHQEKIEQFIIDFVNVQYKIAGVNKDHTYASKHPNWYQEDTITPFRAKLVKTWFVYTYMHRFNATKKSAERELSWAWLNWGLKECR